MKKHIVGIIAFLLITAGVGFGIYHYVIPQQNYNSAMKLKQSGNYEEAIAAFNALGEYQDAPDQSKDCSYQMLVDQYNAINMESTPSGDLNAVRDTRELMNQFKNLGDYADATTYYDNCIKFLQYAEYNPNDNLGYLAQSEAMDLTSTSEKDVKDQIEAMSGLALYDWQNSDKEFTITSDTINGIHYQVLGGYSGNNGGSDAGCNKFVIALRGIEDTNQVVNLVISYDEVTGNDCATVIDKDSSTILTSAYTMTSTQYKQAKAEQEAAIAAATPAYTDAQIQDKVKERATQWCNNAANVGANAMFYTAIIDDCTVEYDENAKTYTAYFNAEYNDMFSMIGNMYGGGQNIVFSGIAVYRDTGSGLVLESFNVF